MSGAQRDERLALVERFFSGTGSSYDRVVNAATFGIDRRWKRILVDAMAPAPRRILDLACGTGILTFRIARRFPRCEVVGVELRKEYLDIARQRADHLGVDNVQLVQSAAEDFSSEEPFDCIVSSYLAKYVDLDALTRNCKAMLAPGGLLITHDFTFPPKPYLVWMFRLYFGMLQWCVAPLMPRWREIFYGLPKLIEQSRWCEELESALHANGFESVRRRDLTLYGSAVVTARKPG